MRTPSGPASFPFLSRRIAAEKMHSNSCGIFFFIGGMGVVGGGFPAKNSANSRGTSSSPFLLIVFRRRSFFLNARRDVRKREGSGVFSHVIHFSSDVRLRPEDALDLLAGAALLNPVGLSALRT